MTRASVRPLLLALLLVLAAGCATPPGEEVPDRSAAVRVVNNAPVDMRVYVVGVSGQRVRLGMAQALGEARLRIPDSVVGQGRDLTFQVEPMASRTIAHSTRMMVRPRQSVTLTIPAYLR